MGCQDTPGAIECIICHPSNEIVDVLRSQGGRPLLLFVSGGERSGVADLPFVSEARTIWFSGVYGRENQFEFWLKEWASRGLSEETFNETKEALFSGKAGVGITADRLGRNLVPLIMLLVGYGAVIEKAAALDAESRSGNAEELQRRLIESLSQLWNEKRLFQALSRDAALIYGAIRNWSAAGRTSQARLVELLADFLPTSAGHWEYDPALDEAFRKVVCGKVKGVAADQVLADWHTKLSELSDLLRALPCEDPGKQS
ncbi:MAG: hypothetical protein LAQ69_29720 [Acidobacteriia bacterium]|nr:hypothetical protein [Terriglobia bacterium]